ncbi:MAG TPA: substrate-binding domain-containing protein [Gammaproteobacteria bacterium]|nr:substrate-binding domain-containing protein [Gammaproteobacteria bacterium]
MRRLLAFCALTALFFSPSLTQAQTNALHVLCSNGMRAVVEELKPQLERAAGQPLAIEYGTSVAVRQKIEGGAEFDVAVLTVEVIDALAKGGKVAPDSVGALGRSPVGIGVRAGSPLPNVETADGVKKAFLDAKSVTWVGSGAARAQVDKMLAALGIADAVAAKLALVQSVEDGLDRVVEGKSDMTVMLASEILPAPGVKYAGRFPAPYTGYVSFAGAASAGTHARAAADRLVAALHAPTTSNVYAAKGVELPH